MKQQFLRLKTKKNQENLGEVVIVGSGKFLIKKQNEWIKDRIWQFTTGGGEDKKLVNISNRFPALVHL